MDQKEKLSIIDLQSIMESAFFTLSRPLSVQDLSRLFHTEKIPLENIKKALSVLSEKYQEPSCGMELKEVGGAYQLRTKEENRDYIRRLIKGRVFQLSSPALEVLVIVAYQQPCRKATVDSIRGVESGHLLKTLMEKNLICFGPKSSDPGRYMTYKTTSQFLEVFGLKSLKDLPSSDDIQDLLIAEGASVNPEEGLTTVLSSLKNSGKSFSEQQGIENELEQVSREINTVKPVKRIKGNKIPPLSSSDMTLTDDK